MNVLILHDETDILAWLVNEPIEKVQAHITNGYPHLQEGWEDETVQAVILEVPEENTFKSGLYEVVDGAVILKV